MKPRRHQTRQQCRLRSAGGAFHERHFIRSNVNKTRRFLSSSDFSFPGRTCEFPDHDSSIGQFSCLAFSLPPSSFLIKKVTSHRSGHDARWATNDCVLWVVPTRCIRRVWSAWSLQKMNKKHRRLLAPVHSGSNEVMSRFERLTTSPQNSSTDTAGVL